VIDRVDLAIFELRYFTRCMENTRCRDWCCSHGVDVDADNAARLLLHREAIERYTGIPSARWFEEGVRRDPEFPGGAHRRTRVENGACVFLDRSRRGCSIHAFCIDQGIDYHSLKPMVSSLFPLTFDDGLLHPSDEVHDRSLVCLHEGPSLYRGVRDELAFYFGAAFVAELDRLEPRSGGDAAAGRRSLRILD
jgi:hypothetical protein